jgi:PAS domain S-box-containing protein
MSEREKVNILMVDDQPGKLLSYETILSGLNENLIRAASGEEALEHLLRTNVAVLLVDVNMPGLGGFELASIIRQHPRFQSTAIIFVSAVHLTDLDRLTGYQLGAVDYVPVPVIPEILRAKVKVFADLFRKTRQLEEINNQLETRVAERTAALAASEERFRLATEAMRGGLYDWDIESDTAWRSVGLAALLGDSAEEREAPREGWRTRIHPEDVQGPWQDAVSAINTEAPSFDVQYRIRHRGGQWIWVWDRGRIVRNNQGHAVRVVGHVTDISAQKNAQDALKEADQRKDEFLATLSHELRNPLAPIRNALDIVRMKSGPLSDLQPSWDVIDRQVTHLSRLIDDLLDVSRISRNKLEMRKSRMDLTEAVKAAIEASSPVLEQHAHQLTVSLNGPVYVDGDLIRLTQVFTNLLNNSAKYTPNGGQVRLTLDREGDSVLVCIRDTGRGISPDNLQHLFKMFYQASDSAPYSHDGFGIGLTLVARIVELHGGSVKAHSAGLNAGSEFTVRLPIGTEASDSGPGTESVVAGAGGSSRNRRVLVADDNVDSAETLAVLLRLQGYAVATAHDGTEALEVASQFQPDAVLLDIGMPALNGYEVARTIRQQDWGKDILIVAQTGWGQDGDRDRSKQAGFDAHLTKPLDLAVLMKLLASAMPLASKTSRSAS